MKLDRLGTLDTAWLLDDRYEIHLSYNHGRYFTIIDRNTLVDKVTWQDGKEVIIKVPQEHTYFDGGGQNSAAYGLHNVTQPV